jgi:hypothetical protein
VEFWLIVFCLSIDVVSLRFLNHVKYCDVLCFIVIVHMNMLPLAPNHNIRSWDCGDGCKQCSIIRTDN